ncbi:hypothetical protein [Nitrosomonas ureae]|uniref:Uncharacterized protein n=1 Tax=Nitrosomonas ureae TaxID=44577 RepID=A0A1H9EJM1_9PROT|nr:hypothetical protein [Nitrosomonas ureae]PTQ85054.1 hypothetical protein C8R28_10156 [Nitrosomonas ureae]PXX16184.1 hypothetical protein C8R27_10799 [Nitrosomonas ureae]SEQ25930.1 hypothetical protein SAMN05421510_103213 [Nitrosomonas ureae]SOD16147.1 hypothetical protein SAMN06297164_0259 [Nitrosomonas ureae]
MSNSYHFTDLKVLVIAISLVLGTSHASFTFPQMTNSEHNHSLPPKTQNLTTQSLPPHIPLDSKPPRTIHRIGTAISTPRNSISIKSTDAGAIRRQSPVSGCINCGIIHSINKIEQGSGMNAIAGGIVAGTVAREIIRQSPHPHNPDYPQAPGDNYYNQGGNIIYPGNQYQINITMDDGRQAIIALPEGASFQQGDRVKWVDGALMLDRHQ